MTVCDPKIFSDGYQLTLAIFSRAKSYPKPFRPTLGRRLEDAAMELLFSIRQAAVAAGSGEGPNRKDFLIQASTKVDEIRILLQLSYEIKILSPAAYAELSELSGVVGKQIGGFLKYARKAGFSVSPQKIRESHA